MLMFLLGFTRKNGRVLILFFIIIFYFLLTLRIILLDIATIDPFILFPFDFILL